MANPIPVIITDLNGNAFAVSGTTSGVQKASPTPVVLTDANGNALVFGAAAIPNGSTATTQAPLANDTKIATDAYADAAVAVEAAARSAADALKAPLASPALTGTATTVALTASGLITANLKLGVNATPSATQDVAIGSLANGNDVIYAKRFTDTSPTGNLIRLQKADAATDLFVVGVNGTITKIGGLTAVGNGVPVLDGNTANSFSAAATATTILSSGSNPTGGGKFLIAFHVQLTTPATTSSTLGGTNGFQVSYTSLDGSVAIANIKPTYTMQSASLTGNTTAAFFSGTILVAAAQATAITFICDYTSVGATPMAYMVRTSCQFLG